VEDPGLNAHEVEVSNRKPLFGASGRFRRSACALKARQTPQPVFEYRERGVLDEPPHDPPVGEVGAPLRPERIAGTRDPGRDSEPPNSLSAGSRCVHPRSSWSSRPAVGSVVDEARLESRDDLARGFAERVGAARNESRSLCRPSCSAARRRSRGLQDGAA
jgi:hypothetical protein